MTSDREPARQGETDSVRPLPDTAALQVVVSTPSGVTSTALPRQKRVTIGRAPECDIMIADESVSRVHAVILDGNPPTLEDAGSRHGTQLFGRKLDGGEAAPLMLGAVIKLGAATLILQRVHAGDAPARAPAPLERSSARPVGAERNGPVVASPRMRELYGILDLVAPSSLPVLVLGETGTGKEVFARSLHDRSPRASGAFVAINCAALPEALLESELFGYAKGAFTGAAQTKVGLFEAANGGTLFLDEVGELPLVTQAKLLRVLETGEITRVGSVAPIRVDVRLVAATNKDLRALVEQQRFREDLLFRLDGVSVVLPPLRDRHEDIALLARRFAVLAAEQLGRDTPSLTEDAIAYLEAQPWPGNVRELRHAIDRVIALSPGAGRLEARHFVALPRSATSAPPVESVNAPAQSHSPAPPLLRTSIDAFERERILEALRGTMGNQTEAAKRLGIGRRTLITKMELYAIDRPRKKPAGV